MFVDYTFFMTFGHSKLVRQQKCNYWVSYRPPTAHLCFTAPLEILTAHFGNQCFNICKFVLLLRIDD